MGQLGLGDDETEMLVPGPLSIPGGMRVTQVLTKLVKHSF